MYCPKCGAVVNAGASFCSACGTAVAAPPVVTPPVVIGPASAGAPADVLKRPGLITFLGVLQIIGAVCWLLGGGVYLASGLSGSTGMSPGVFAGAIVAAGIGVVLWICGQGLLKLRPHGRTLLIVFSVIGLLGIPLGTIVSILILIYLFRPGIKILFSGKEASELTAEDVAAVNAARISPVVIVLVGVVVLVLLFILAGVIAAIAVPSLLRARQAGNEASAQASLRAIASAQVLYASACGGGGFATTLEDLAKPPRGGGEPFVVPDLNTNGVAKNGYRFHVEGLTPSTSVTPAASTCNGARADAVSGFFASAEPENSAAGSRYFAVDSAMTVYVSEMPISNPITPSVIVRPVQ